MVIVSEVTLVFFQLLNTDCCVYIFFLSQTAVVCFYPKLLCVCFYAKLLCVLLYQTAVCMFSFQTAVCMFLFQSAVCFHSIPINGTFLGISSPVTVRAPTDP